MCEKFWIVIKPKTRSSFAHVCTRWCCKENWLKVCPLFSFYLGVEPPKRLGNEWRCTMCDLTKRPLRRYSEGNLSFRSSSEANPRISSEEFQSLLRPERQIIERRMSKLCSGTSFRKILSILLSTEYCCLANECYQPKCFELHIGSIFCLSSKAMFSI